MSTDLFCDNFSLDNTDLTHEQKQKLYACLYEKKQVFVTNASPDLGFTKIVEHEIHLKPDAVPKQQKPYRLPPDKREVLLTQLEELLRQGVIAPVDEGGQLLITSPIYNIFI